MARNAVRFLTFAAVLFAFGVSDSFAQQIVSDPVLDAQLVAFEQNFNQYVAAHPELTYGSSQPIHLEGKKGKISYTYDVQGTYTVTYQGLDLAPTDPISADRFRMTLTIGSIRIEGDAALEIMRKTTSWSLDCPDNELSVQNLVYSSEVQVTQNGSVLVTNSKVKADRNSVVVSVPCLGAPAARDEALDEADVFDDLADDLADDFGDAMNAVAAPPGQVPPKNVTKKVNSSLQSTAGESNSDVMDEASTTAETTGASVAASAGNACSDAIRDDVDAIVDDLGAISAQANEQGFTVAIQQFVANLQVIVPTLTAPAQEIVQAFIDDLEAAIAEDGPGGTTITPAEQFGLTNDFYAVLFSTGISTSDLLSLEADLAAVFDSLSGISTAQLQADLAELVADIQGCTAQ